MKIDGLYDGRAVQRASGAVAAGAASGFAAALDREDDVLVLRRVHVVAEGIGCLEELLFKAEIGF